jgi:hypothetical protein
LERFFTLAAQRMHSPKREHGMLLGQVAPAGVPLAVSPAGAGLRRITLYQLSRLWANALAV